MRIDDTTYKIKDNNHYKTQTAKTQIILGSSLRKNSHHITRLLHKEYGNTKRWNTYTVTREGIVYQHYDNKYYSDYLGIKEADKKSVSIVLENMGALYETSKDKYVNWLNEICDESNVVERKWLGFEYWEQYTDAQIESLAELCIELCTQFNIPKVCIDFNHYHKDTVKFRGIVFKSNYDEDTNDVNPLFNIQKFNAMLHNEFI